MYNTILGAKPLLADGSTFYYSDYNFHGHKFYKKIAGPVVPALSRKSPLTTESTATFPATTAST